MLLVGRIGLLNLGQTCFLNVVLQSLLHNPLLRNYFLSDKHNYKMCKNTDCMCCEMDKLFTEVGPWPVVFVTADGPNYHNCRFTRVNHLPTVHRAFLRRHGGRLRNSRVMLNKTLMSSLCLHSTSYIKARRATRASHVIVRYMRSLEARYRARRLATSAGQFRGSRSLFWTLVCSSRVKDRPALTIIR